MLRAAVLAAGMAMLPALTAAEPLDMQYDVNIGGIRALKLNYIGDAGKKRYNALVNLKPVGIASLFIREKIEMKVNGAIAKSNVRPITFFMKTGRKKKVKQSTVTWQGRGKPAYSRMPPRSAKKHSAIIKALKGSAIDPLSTLIRQGLKNHGEPCSGKQRIFDGHIVYDLDFALLGKETDIIRILPDKSSCYVCIKE